MCVWFPKWSIQRLRSERPDLDLNFELPNINATSLETRLPRRKRASGPDLVLFTRHGQRLLVTECTPGAERRGVCIGQSLAEAKALVPRAAFLPADLAADRQALALLALEGQRFSPLVGLEDAPHPESLLSDVTGCTHLWNGEEPFVEAVRDDWTKRGYHVRLALAGTLGAAWALAHADTTAPTAVIPAGGEAAALGGLSVALLRLPPVVLERLEALGLRTIGDVLALPRETLASRFDLILPRRLDEALGQRAEALVVERLHEPLAAAREWDVPLDDRLTLEHVCRQMLQELLSRTPHPGAGLQELDGELRTETGTVALEIRLVEPARDEAYLGQLVALHLERCTWSGGVVAVRWTVTRLGRLPQVAREWFADSVADRAEADASRQVAALVDRLSSRLGSDVVLRAETLPDAQPERAVRLVPRGAARPDGSREGKEEYALPPDQSRCRPCRLLGIPLPITVASVVPDGTPVRVTWRGRDYRAIRCWGPERIDTGWWHTHDVQRDYYRVEWEDGTHVWIFRDRRIERWFLHGFFE